MSVNGISFGCVPRKNLNLPRNMAEQVEKKLGIPNTEVDVAELIKAAKKNREALAKKPVLKLDKWGHVDSTKEECEAFIKWAEEYDKETLNTAIFNLNERKQRLQKSLDEYNANPAAWRRFHPGFLPPSMHKTFGNSTPRDICNEYMHVKEMARRKAQSNNPFDSFKTKAPSKYLSKNLKNSYNA